MKKRIALILGAIIIRSCTLEILLLFEYICNLLAYSLSRQRICFADLYPLVTGVFASSGNFYF